MTELILKPRVSEKAMMLAESKNVYVFEVPKPATKPMVKAAVETRFKVKVELVTMIVTKGKLKRFQKTLGRQNDVKKAYVKLAKGQSIKLFEGAS
jgi:large subunit ribosomal protein L23